MNHSKADSIEFKVSLQGKSHRLSRNFTLGEFQSKCGADTVLVHPALIVGIQAVRDAIGKPLTVNSGFRTVDHNQAVNGSSNSFHLYGMAADLSGVDPKLIATEARKVGLTARPYQTFCHVDVGPNRNW
jgi:uncharacterized protein YcbK (DUF882 family)